MSHITGMPCADGKSVLLTFNNTSKCAEYLKQCANSRHAVQISIWKLVITRMQQYQCREKIFKFQIKTPQINSTHTVTFPKKEHEGTNMNSHTSKPQKRTPYSEITDDKITHSETIKGSEAMMNEKT